MAEERPSIEEPPGEDRSRGEGFPQILHDRARTSGQELHKLLVTFSTGLLAIYFLALTGRDDPADPGLQTIAVLVGLLATGCAVFFGLAAYYCDMKRNYLRASALQAGDQKARDDLFVSRDLWLGRRRWSIRALNVFFGVGTVAALAYVGARVLGV